MKNRAITMGIIALALAAVIAAACNFQTTAQKADSWTDKAIEQYKDQYPYYRILDINGDGNNELFLSNQEGTFFTDEGKVLLLANQDGKIKKVEEYSYPGGFFLYFNAEEHKLTFLTRLSGSGEAHICRYNGDKMKEETVLENYGPFHDPRVENRETTYYVNRKAVQKADYDKYANKYMKENYQLKLHEIDQ